MWCNAVMVIILLTQIIHIFFVDQRRSSITCCICMYTAGFRIHLIKIEFTFSEPGFETSTKCWTVLKNGSKKVTSIFVHCMIYVVVCHIVAYAMALLY